MHEASSAVIDRPFDQCQREKMDTNFQQILKIATDALSLKYPLEYAVLYWQGDADAMESKATIEVSSDKNGKVIRFSLSESLMSAILKPLIIVKTDSDPHSMQIIIPLIDNNQKVGIMAFWGKPEGEVIKESDRRYLDMIGFISLRVLTGLNEGDLVAESGLIEPVENEVVELEAPLFDDDDTIESVVVTHADEEEDEVLIPDISKGYERSESEEEMIRPIDVGESDDDPEIDFSNVQTGLQEEIEQDARSDAKPRAEFERLLDFTKIGFLVFDKEGKIDTNHMVMNTGFFEIPLEKKTALEMLFEWGKPANEDSASFDRKPKYEMITDLMQSVFSRVTDIDVLKEFLPTEIDLGMKCYGVDYHYLKSIEDMNQDSILAVFTDISHEKKLAADYATEVDRTNMIIKVALDIDGYYQYRLSTENTFEKIDEELSKAPSEVNLESILHHIQAIQGGAEIYEINELTILSEELLSTLEEKIVSFTPITGSETKLYRSRFMLIKDRFEHLQKQYLNNLISDEQILDKAVYRNTKAKILKIRNKIVDHVLKKHMAELEETFEKNYKPFTRLKTLEDITKKRLDRIKEHISSRILKEGAGEITQIMSELRKQPIGLMLKRYAIIAVNLGERLKKRVEVEVKGADVEVPFHQLENLFTGLTFVIRNCVEHGLESMEERIALNKSLEGNIGIEAALENNLLSITISDDGRGIDIDKIRKAAVENRLVSESDMQGNDQEILKLMFSKGFSTKKDSRGTFGRGVGLNAVGSSVEELNGEVMVQTRPKQGTTIKVEVPL